MKDKQLDTGLGYIGAVRVLREAKEACVDLVSLLSEVPPTDQDGNLKVGRSRILRGGIAL